MPCNLSICAWFFFKLFSKIKLDKLECLGISDLIFGGYTCSKNRVRNRLKIKFVQLDFWKKFHTRFFKNQEQMDRVLDWPYNFRMRFSILDYCWHGGSYSLHTYYVLTSLKKKCKKKQKITIKSTKVHNK